MKIGTFEDNKILHFKTEPRRYATVKSSLKQKRSIYFEENKEFQR